MSDDSVFDISEPKRLVVIDGDEAKVFRATAYLGLDPSSLTYQNPVPVRGVGGRHIVGYASLYPDNGGVTATVVMDYVSAERLLTQTGEYPLWMEPLFSGGRLVELSLTTSTPKHASSRLMALE